MKCKILIKTMLLALLISFCGCGGGKNRIPEHPEMHIETITQASNKSVDRYNGDAQEFFEVENDSETVVEVTVQQESGALRIMIQEENNPENIVYDGNTFPSGFFTVTVKEPGAYHVWIHAENFVGFYQLQYDLNWS